MLVLLTRLITRKGRVVLNRKYVKHGEEWRWRDATTMSSAGRLPGDVVESRVCWRSLAESLQSSIEKRANPRWKSNAWNEEKRNDDATTLLISRRTFLFPFLLLLFSLWHRRFQFAANARARKLSLSLSPCLCSVYSFFHPASRIFRLPACIPRKYTDYSPNHWFRRFLSFFSPDGEDGEQRIKKKRKMLSIEHARGFTWGKIVVIDRARLFCLVSEFEARCGFEIGDQSLRGKREIFVENLGNDINALIL